MAKSIEWFRWGFVASVFFGLAFVFMHYFQTLPIEGTSLGIDLIFYAFRDWGIHYDVVNGLRNPPWSVLILIPLGALPDKAAWGLLVYGTLVAMVMSVPNRGTPKLRYWLAVLLLIASYPSLRNIADANLEGLVIAGAALLVYGYRDHDPYILAAGILLATAKPQAATLLLLVTGVYTLQTWQPREWIKAGAVVLAVVIPTFLWRGRQWLDAVQGTYQAGSIIDISLSAAMERTGNVSQPVILLLMAVLLITTLVIAWRSKPTLSREKAGMLMAGMLLLSPYAAGNSVVTILAIGIIPLFLVRPWWGALLIALINFPYFWTREWLFLYQSYWWTAILVLTWAILCWRIIYKEMWRQQELAGKP